MSCWYWYKDGLLHVTREIKTGTYPGYVYGHDENGVPLEQAICGKINDYVCGAIEGHETFRCPDCARLLLMEELGA